MATLGRVYPCRVTLLNCNQIHPSLPQSLSLANSPWPVTSAPATKPAAGLDDSASHDMLDFWRPLCPAPPPTSQPLRSRIRPSDTAMLNVWLCPEIDSRQRRERARRRKAEQLAERMTALVQASDINKGRKEEPPRGTKRKNNDRVEDTEVTVVPLLPSSPDLARPQSLLIPALLPKGMLRSQADPAPTQPKAPPALDLAREVPAASSVGAGDMPFGLGLDLGFDIAQSAAKRGPLSGGGSGMSSSIMEIADFLERDIDVFTPL
ncbi:hypothetical protein GGI24_003826, partial [Coemansia furcata]